MNRSNIGKLYKRMGFFKNNKTAGQASRWANSILKGFGQIMLQKNAVTGLLFLAGIFIGSIFMGVASFVAVLVGTITAKLMKFDPKEVSKGIYGFSAALTGVALALLFKNTIATWVAIVLGSALAAMLQHFFIKLKANTFTLPFVLVTWLVLLVMHFATPSNILASTLSSSPFLCPFSFALTSYGQVIFQGKFISGLLFFIAVFVGSPRAALYGLAGGVIASIFSFYLAAPTESVAMGLFGYNAVLSAIVFAGKKRSDGAWAIAAVGLSVAIHFRMLHYAIPPLTFPFVLASIIIQRIKTGLQPKAIGRVKNG